MKKILCIILTLTVLAGMFCLSVSAYDNSLMSDDAWELLSYCVDFFHSTGMRFDKNTSAEEILNKFIFGSIFQFHQLDSPEFYTLYQGSDPKNLFSYYGKYYGENIDEIMRLVFNVSEEEINKIHNDGRIYSFPKEHTNFTLYYNPVYYYNGCYYTEYDEGDWYTNNEIIDYIVLENYGNNTYKLRLNVYWHDIDSDGMPPFTYYAYCIIKPSADGRYFTLYGISDKDDIDYTPDNVVTLPTFPVTLNGVTVANDYREYPFLVYNGVTYFPMTYSDCGFLGLETSWSAESGLIINKSGFSSEYADYSGSSRNPASDTAEIAEGRIVVNGTEINNSAEEYPLLLYRNVTYFPLTWRFAVDEFGWEYSFTSEGGLVINN